MCRIWLAAFWPGPMPACPSVPLNRFQKACMHSDKDLDARNLNCPLPILRCKKALNELGAEQVLKITATDPGSKKDFDAFCRQTGHTLLDTQEAEGVFTFWIRKRNA
jgi:tRNA 2-thiouridine synthesizing protein A